MSLFCRSCEGEMVVDAFYADDSKRTIRATLESCSCVGGHRTGLEGPRPGERKVTASQAQELKTFWASAPQAEPPFQAAA